MLLQKEQSLLTAPSASGYAKATGYACPDTAACDKKYLGFFNQVYRAAWQFREYTLHPDEWRYRIGAMPIQYHPNAACGASTVRIVNQATANLYNYTPYQPNARDPRQPEGSGGRVLDLRQPQLLAHLHQLVRVAADRAIPGLAPGVPQLRRRSRLSV